MTIDGKCIILAALLLGSCAAAPPPPQTLSPASELTTPKQVVLGGWEQRPLDTDLARTVLVQAAERLKLTDPEKSSARLTSLETQVVAGTNVKAWVTWERDGSPQQAEVNLFRALDGTWH